MEEKRIKHYSSHHKILLIGEGDFSFALCLAKAFGSATNMVATSLDSEAFLRKKYSGAIENLNELKKLGCTILHGVDVHAMTQHPSLQHKHFDRIVFNFPHAGFIISGRWPEHSYEQIEWHKKLVRGFMRNGAEMMRKDGEMHVSHKTAHPFSNWEIEKIAEEAGLHLHEQVPFEISDYEGYCHKRGYGRRWDRPFPLGMCSTFIFRKPRRRRRHRRRTLKNGIYIPSVERMIEEMSGLQVTMKDTEEARGSERPKDTGEETQEMKGLTI